jgi:hypothetical protein
MRSLPAGRQPTRSAGGNTRPRHSSSIYFSFTQEPSQDPFGKVGGSTSLPEAAPFPLGRDTLGAIWVRIWMSGMVAERTRNPNPVGTKLGSGGSRVERMPKEEEKRATGARLQERSPVYKRGGGSVAYFTHDGLATDPFRHEPRPRKDRATTVVAAKDRGPGPIGRNATVRGQVEPRSSPRGSKFQGAGPRRAAAWRLLAGSVSEPAHPETAGNTPQDLTSRPITSKSNKESWDFDENKQDFGEKKNPPKPHANP